MSVLRLGTRRSALALAQARAVGALLREPFELVEITTAGDVDRARGDKSRWVGALETELLDGRIDLAVHSAKDVPGELATITTAGDVDRARGDKSRWVGALETELLDGRIDLAVHSAKDVPGELAPGTVIAATPRRADPLDTLVGERGLRHLREGARVGTSALRRRAQVLAARPDVEVVEIRGNVDTRLRKREAGEVDVLILAAAGLERLGRETGHRLDFVPAPGQGVIAVQARAGSPAAEAAAAADHAHTHAYLEHERTAVRLLGATCHTPVGVFAEGDRVRGFAGLPDGSAWLLDEAQTGEELARRMLAAGAADLLREAEAMIAA